MQNSSVPFFARGVLIIYLMNAWNVITIHDAWYVIFESEETCRFSSGGIGHFASKIPRTVRAIWSVVPLFSWVLILNVFYLVEFYNMFFSFQSQTQRTTWILLFSKGKEDIGEGWVDTSMHDTWCVKVIKRVGFCQEATGVPRLRFQGLFVQHDLGCN